MKYHILQVFKTSIEFIKKSSDHFKDLHKMEFLTNFDFSLTSFLGGVMNLTHNFELLLEITSYWHQNLSGASVSKYL